MGISLTAIVALIIFALVLRFATKIFMKLIGFVFVVFIVFAGMYYFQIGIFAGHTTDVNELVDRYCDTEEQGDTDICDCVIRLARADMEMRFSEDELTRVHSNRLKSLHVLQRSLMATENEARECLAAREADDKYEEFIQAVIPYRSEYFDKVEEEAVRLKDRLNKEYQDFLKEKDELDRRY